MTQKEAVQKFLDGELCAIVEFTRSKAERIKWRDKESRQMMEAPMLKHNVMNAAGEPYIVNERVADTFNETTFKPVYKRGDKVFLTYSLMTVEKGVKHLSGALEPLTN